MNTLLMIRSFFQSAAVPAILLVHGAWALAENNGQSATSSATWVSVMDFGAVGDGKTDDSLAIQKTFDAACPPNDSAGTTRGFKKVIFPAGKYRVTQSLKLLPTHNSLVIEGTGSAYASGGKLIRAKTQIVWDGNKGGFLFDVYGVFGLQMHDLYLDGSGKAAVLLRCNSIDKWTKTSNEMQKKWSQAVSDEWFINRVSFENAETGFELAGDSYVCNGDFTLIDLSFLNCGTGFVTLSEQALNYNFIRPQIGLCDIGLYFKEGGSVNATMLTGYGCGTCIKIDRGGINAGVFNFTGIRVEARAFKGKRTQLLYAEGEVNVKISSLVTTCMGITEGVSEFGTQVSENDDKSSPVFTVKNGAQVFVDASMVSGNVAVLSSKGVAPSFLQFDNCRFRFVSDPKKIKLDENSGYELRNCLFTDDEIKDKKYIQRKTVLIKNYGVYPKGSE